MRRIRVATALITIIPCIVLACGVGAYLLKLANIAMRGLPKQISDLAAQQINGKVSIGSVTSSAYGIVLHNVSITPRGVSSRKPIAIIPSIRVRANLQDVISGKIDPQKSIDYVELSHPVIYLDRDKSGKWNYSNIFKPAGKRPISNYRTRVYVTDAQLTVQDSANVTGRSVTSAFRHLSASIDVGDRIDFKFKGQGDGKRLGNLQGSGRYVVQRGELALDANARAVDVVYWTGYPVRLKINVLSGQADCTCHVERRAKGEPFHYTSDIQLKDGSIAFKPIHKPFTRVKGLVRVCDGAIGMSLNGNLGKSDFVVDGCVAGFHNPRMMICAESDRADLAEVISVSNYSQVLNKLKISPRGSVKLTLFGIPSSLAADFSVKLSSVTIASMKIDSPDLSGVYFDHRLTLTSANGVYSGGRLNMSGSLDLTSSQHGLFSGRLTDCSLDSIPWLDTYKIRGKGGGDFQIAWKPGKISARCNARVPSGNAGGIAFDEATIAATYSDGSLTIRRAGMRSLGGLIVASGTVSKAGQLNMAIAGNGLDTAKLVAGRMKGNASGSMQFAGKITGDLHRPVFDGEFEAYKLSASQYEVDRIAGIISAGRHSIDISDLRVYDGNGQVRVKGRINSPLSDKPDFDLDVSATDLPIQKLAKWGLKTGRISGFASGDIKISGSVKNPKASGILRGRCVQLSSTPLDNALIKFAYESGTASIETLQASCGNSTLVAQGTIKNDKSIDLAFSAEKFPLAKLNKYVRQYAVLTGTATIAGSVGGTIDKAIVQLSANSTNTAINNEGFDKIECTVKWNQGNSAVGNIVLRDAKSEYSLTNLAYDPVKHVVELDARIVDGKGQKIAGILNNSLFVQNGLAGRLGRYDYLASARDRLGCSISGEVNGRIRLQGKRVYPDLRGQANVNNFVCGSKKIQSLDVAGSWRGENIILDKFEASDGDMNISADGNMVVGGLLNVRLDAHNVAVDNVREWVRIPDNFSGRGDVTLVVRGRADAPNAEMFMECVDPVLAGLKFDRIRTIVSTNAGDAENGGTGIHIDDVTLVQGDKSLRATGFLPMDWRTLKIPRDGKLAAEAKLDEGSLSILSTLSGIKFQLGSGGSFGGVIKLAGTVGDPSLQGSIGMKKGIARIPRVDGEFRNVNAKISLVENRLVIDTISGSSSEGGGFEASGKVVLSSTNPAVDMNVVSKGLQFSGQNISNRYGEYVRVKVNGNLKIGGVPKYPVIAGTLYVPEGQLALVGKGTVKAAARMLPMDPQFDVSVLLGRNVEFHTSRLRCPLYGKLVVAGSLSKAIVDGNVDIAGGRILFPMHQLRIASGSSISLHAAPPDPAVVYVDMSAQGTIPTVGLSGSQKNCTVTMVSKGPLDKMDSTFSSSPAILSDQDIMSILTGKRQLETAFAERGASDLDKFWSAAVLPTLFQAFGNVFQDATGIQDFGLEAGYNQPMRFTIGNQLFGGLYLDYTRVMGSKPGYYDSLEELKMSYRFKRGYELNMSKDENDILKLGVEGRFRF